MKTEFWLKLAARKSRYGTAWEFHGVPKASVNKPDTGSDEIAIKMHVEIPDSYFTDPQMTIKLVVPEPQDRATVHVDAKKLGRHLANQIGTKVFVNLEGMQQ